MGLGRRQTGCRVDMAVLLLSACQLNKLLVGILCLCAFGSCRSYPSLPTCTLLCWRCCLPSAARHFAFIPLLHTTFPFSHPPPPHHPTSLLLPAGLPMPALFCFWQRLSHTPSIFCLLPLLLVIFLYLAFSAFSLPHYLFPVSPPLLASCPSPLTTALLLPSLAA